MSPKGVGERPDQDLGPPMETDVSVRVPCAAAIHPSRGLRGPLCRLKPRSLTRRGKHSGQPASAPQASLRCLCPWQVKIMTEKELLAVACEQFLGKNVQDIKNVVLQTLEGHLRSILGEALPSL